MIPGMSGSGDYDIGPENIQANSLIHDEVAPTSTAPMAPEINQTVFKFTERSYLGDLKSATSAGIIQPYTLDVTNPGTFPKAAVQAQLWQRWRLTGCVFTYVPNIGTAVVATVPTLGYVSITPIANAVQALPTTKFELFNYADAVTGVPSRGLVCGVECAHEFRALQWNYTRTNVVPGAALDVRFQDPGYVAIAAGEQLARGELLGQIWITAEIEFCFPKLPNPASPEALLLAERQMVLESLRETRGPGLISSTELDVLCGIKHTPADDELKEELAAAAKVYELEVDTLRRKARQTTTLAKIADAYALSAAPEASPPRHPPSEVGSWVRTGPPSVAGSSVSRAPSREPWIDKP